MIDEKPLTPGEIAAGQTPEKKRAELEATGFRHPDVIAANDAERAHAAKVILESAAKFDKPVRMRGHVHSDA